MFRFLIYSSLLILVYSCGNESEQKKEEILDSFKAASKDLEKTKRLVFLESATAAFYDTLTKKLVGTDEYSKITQMRVAFQDFYFYNSDLRTEFFKFCGDNEGRKIPAGKEGEINLTTQYFIERGYADDLYGRMQKVSESLPPRLTSEKDMESILGTLRPRNEAGESAELFLNAYFNNVPPVAAVTILNTFDLKLRRIEHNVLFNYNDKFLSTNTKQIQ